MYCEGSQNKNMPFYQSELVEKIFLACVARTGPPDIFATKLSANAGEAAFLFANGAGACHIPRQMKEEKRKPKDSRKLG